MSTVVNIDRQEALGRAITALLQIQGTALPTDVATVHVRVAHVWASIAQTLRDGEVWTGDLAKLTPVTWSRS